MRIVAQYAHAWNTFGAPEVYAAKNTALTEWCTRIDRDPGEIERTVLVMGDEQIVRWGDYVDAGAEHILVGVGHPFDLSPVERLLAQIRA